MRSTLTDLAEPLRYPAFRRVWLSGLVGQLGDWAARLALAVVVFDRTGSALVSAASLAVSILPWLGPGQWITALTERWSRRTVMVGADLLRAGVFVLAATGLPIPVLFVLLFLAGLCTPPFEAARSSVLPDLLPAPVFASSQALRGITDDVTLIGGYAIGGAALAVLDARAALLLNAAALVGSALILIGLPLTPAPSADGTTGSATRLAEAARLVLRTPVLRRAALSVTVALAAADTLVLLAVPRVVGELHGSPATVPWLLAAAGGVTIAATVLVPHRSAERVLIRAAAALLAVGGLGAAVALLLDQGLVGMVAAFTVSGLLATVIVPANIVVGLRLPSHLRASALSILIGALYAAQAVVPVLAGAAADAVGVLPTWIAVTALAGGYGVAALLRPVATEDAHRRPALGDPPGAVDTTPRSEAPVTVDLTDRDRLEVLA